MWPLWKESGREAYRLAHTREREAQSPASARFDILPLHTFHNIVTGQLTSPSPLNTIMGSRTTPLSIESLLEKQRAEKEAAAKVRFDNHYTNLSIDSNSVGTAQVLV